MHVVLNTIVEGSGVYSGWVPSEGTQPAKTQITLHVLALEVKGCDPTGCPGATTTVWPMWNVQVYHIT